MPRKPRQLEVEGVYHIVKRGVEKRDIFLKPQDYSRFILGLEFCNSKNPADLWSLVGTVPTKLKERLEERRQEKEKSIVDVLAFALMPNHIHLILREIIEGGISLYMRKLGGYSTYFNKQYGRVGPLFQSRFKDVPVKNDIQLHNVFVYVHTNPVELWEPDWKEFRVRNLEVSIRKLEEYKSSSYNDYIGRKQFPFVMNNEFFLSFYGSEQKCKQAVEDWIRFKGGVTHLGDEIIE